jgi:hypothetical protein
MLQAFVSQLGKFISNIVDSSLSSPFSLLLQVFRLTYAHAVAYRGGGFGGFKPPPLRNSEVLTKLSRIPSSVENTSVTT